MGAKLSLALNPTFAATVLIPMPGGEPAPVVFTFRHKTRTQMAAFLSARAPKDVDAAEPQPKPELVDVVGRAVERDADMVMEIATGWDLDDAFARDSVVRLIDLYEKAAGAILSTYAEENAGHKAKN